MYLGYQVPSLLANVTSLSPRTDSCLESSGDQHSGASSFYSSLASAHYSLLISSFPLFFFPWLLLNLFGCFFIQLPEPFHSTVTVATTTWEACPLPGLCSEEESQADTCASRSEVEISIQELGVRCWAHATAQELRGESSSLPQQFQGLVC